MNTEQAIIAVAPPPHVCPKHPDVPLWGVLKGGSGFCRSCDFYVQAAGVPLPPLPPKPEQAKTKAKGKAKKKTTTKRKRKVVTKTPSRRRDNLTA